MTEDEITREPVFTTKPFTADHTQYKVTARIRLAGTEHELETSAVMRPGMAVTPLLKRGERGWWQLSLVDPEDHARCYAATVQAPAGSAEEPWPRVEAIPPGVWTRLAHGAGSVLNETGATATITVAEDGTLTFGAAMKWQSDGAALDYDSWGEDA